MQVDINTVEYAGFGVRLLASVLDSIVQLLVIVPLAWMLFGSDFFMNPEFEGGMSAFVINWVFPALYSILFWQYRSATPGKIWMGIMIIDAKTGARPGMDKLLLRFVGYIICGFTLFLGFMWILVDKQKRGLHDIIARTLVIKTPMEATPEARHFMDR